SDSRISPVRRLVRRLIDACESGGSPSPGVAEGYRVQCLIDAARRAHATGRWTDVAPPAEPFPNLVSPGLSQPRRMRANYASNAAQYVPALTGIRALAALLVLGMHTEQNVPFGLDSFLPFFARGYLGVDFFFVLSGFIITHVYFASLASPSRSAVQIFLWHRFIRLYPVHITVLAGLVAVFSLAHAAGCTFTHPQEWQWNELLWQLTLLHAWGVTATPGWNAPSWSISAEWFAYLLFPLLAPALVWVRERGIALLIAAAALAGTALLFAMADWTLNTWVGA